MNGGHAKGNLANQKRTVRVKGSMPESRLSWAYACTSAAYKYGIHLV